MESKKENASTLYCRSLGLAHTVDTGQATAEQAIDAVVTAHDLLNRVAMLASSLDAMIGLATLKMGEVKARDSVLVASMDKELHEFFTTIPLVYSAYDDELVLVRKINRMAATKLLAEDKVDINDAEGVKSWMAQKKMEGFPTTNLENN